MPQNVSKETPLAEIILRKYERPSNLSKRDLTKKLCLSIGLLQPGDSRDVVVDVLCILLGTKKALSPKEIRDQVVIHRKQHSLPLNGIADSNIRRQLKRLKDLFLVESNQNQYRITENESLINIFEEKIEKFYLQSIKERVRDYFIEISKQQKI